MVVIVLIPLVGIGMKYIQLRYIIAFGFFLMGCPCCGRRNWY